METHKASYFESRTKVPESTAPQLKVTGPEFDSTSSSHEASWTPKDRSLKFLKMCPSRLSELESELTKLQENLKDLKDQLGSSEFLQNHGPEAFERIKKQLLASDIKLHISLHELLGLSYSEEARLQEVQKTSKEHDQASLAELEAVQKKHIVDSTALTSALDENERLKIQLQMAAESEAIQTKLAETTYAEIQSLKVYLVVTLALAKILDTQLRDCKESETQAQTLVEETLLQFETVKGNAEKFRTEVLKRLEVNNSLTSELEKSKMQVNSLEELVCKLQLDLATANRNNSGVNEHTPKIGEDGNVIELEKLKMECSSKKLEVEQLKRALDKYQEKQLKSTMKTLSAYELVERTKAEVSVTEAKLKLSEEHIDELKATLLEKENELQSILKEIECLKIENNQSSEVQSKLEIELKKSKEDYSDLMASFFVKETELLRILEEKEILELEVKKKEMENNDAIADVEAAKTVEQETRKKLGYAKQEADENSRRAARVVEQLEIVQASNSELEAELRRIKGKSDQWRKAAEAAALVLYPISGEFRSLNSDMDDDSLKGKNRNMLKKVGALWKGQK